MAFHDHQQGRGSLRRRRGRGYAGARGVAGPRTLPDALTATVLPQCASRWVVRTHHVRRKRMRVRPNRSWSAEGSDPLLMEHVGDLREDFADATVRSEERRVGKE